MSGSFLSNLKFCIMLNKYNSNLQKSGYIYVQQQFTNNRSCIRTTAPYKNQVIMRHILNLLTLNLGC